MSDVRKELQITNLSYYKFQYKFHILVGDVDCGTVVWYRGSREAWTEDRQLHVCTESYSGSGGQVS